MREVSLHSKTVSRRNLQGREEKGFPILETDEALPPSSSLTAASDRFVVAGREINMRRSPWQKK